MKKLLEETLPSNGWMGVCTGVSSQRDWPSLGRRKLFERWQEVSPRRSRMKGTKGCSSVLEKEPRESSPNRQSSGGSPPFSPPVAEFCL